MGRAQLLNQSVRHGFAVAVVRNLENVAGLQLLPVPHDAVAVPSQFYAPSGIGEPKTQRARIAGFGGQVCQIVGDAPAVQQQFW